MRRQPNTRVVRSRDSLYLALVSMIREDGYNLSIQSTDLCTKANRSRATFFRQYRQVGDIFRLKDQEILERFLELDFVNLSKKLIWQRTLLFIVQYRDVFTFKMDYDRDMVLRKMIEGLRDAVMPELRRYEAGLAEKLFEMFYAEARGIIKIWIKNGAKTGEISQVARYLDYAASSVCGRWGTFFKIV